MIAVYVSTFASALVSAFFPVTPVEPYVVGVVAVTGCWPVGVGLTAAAGQTVGKTVIFLGARGVFRSERVREWVGAASEHRKRKRAARGARPVSAARERVRALGGPLRAAGTWLTRLLERPALTVPVLFVSAFLGLPPLLATSIYIAGTRVRTPVFVAVCFVGRSARFIVIAYAPQLVLG